jgi:hypothetical protein
MGARNNIIVHQPTVSGACENTQPLYLYSHWHGQELDKVVMQAIELADDRLGDPTYFTRILFATMVADDYTVLLKEVGAKPTLLTGSKGYGISVNAEMDQDYYYPIHVNWRFKPTGSWVSDNYELYFVRNDIEYTADQFFDAAFKNELPQRIDEEN